MVGHVAICEASDLSLNPPGRDFMLESRLRWDLRFRMRKCDVKFGMAVEQND